MTDKFKLGDKVLCTLDHRVNSNLTHKKHEVFTIVHEVLVDFFEAHRDHYRLAPATMTWTPVQTARFLIRKHGTEKALGHAQSDDVAAVVKRMLA